MDFGELVQLVKNRKNLDGSPEMEAAELVVEGDRQLAKMEGDKQKIFKAVTDLMQAGLKGRITLKILNDARDKISPSPGRIPSPGMIFGYNPKIHGPW